MQSKHAVSYTACLQTNRKPGPPGFIGCAPEHDAKMARQPTSNPKLPIPSNPVKADAAESPPLTLVSEVSPPESPPDGGGHGQCNHDAPPQCSNCGAIFTGAELCRDPDAHACAIVQQEAFPDDDEDQDVVQAESSTAPYVSDWPKNAQGHALVTFTNPHTKRSATIPCFKDYVDRETGVTMSICAVEQRIPGWIAEIISGRSPNAWKEEAAHVPGRDTNSHARMYFSVPFFRDYVFVGLHRDARRQTRADRRWKIRRRHRDCSDPCCRKRHK